MAKRNESKFKGSLSKRQAAGALLLSSTAIGVAGSNAASANAVTDFFKNAGTKIGDGVVWGLDKAGDVLKSGVTKGYNFVNNNIANGKITEYAGKIIERVKNSKAGNGFSKLYNDIRKTDLYKKYGEPVANFAIAHSWGLAAVTAVTAVTYMVYLYVTRNERKLQRAYKNFSDAYTQLYNQLPKDTGSKAKQMLLPCHNLLNEKDYDEKKLNEIADNINKLKETYISKNQEDHENRIVLINDGNKDNKNNPNNPELANIPDNKKDDDLKVKWEKMESAFKEFQKVYEEVRKPKENTTITADNFLQTENDKKDDNYNDNEQLTLIKK